MTPPGSTGALTDFRVTFVGHDGHRWALVRSHEVGPEHRDRTVPPADAAEMVASSFDDMNAWPSLHELFEDLAGGLLRAPSARDIESAMLPALVDAINRGDLVALREPRKPLVMRQAPRPFPSAQPKPPRKVVDKHFLDVRVMDDKGVPLSGRRYRLQLPNGIKEEGRLDSAARIFKPNVDEGTARLWLLPEDHQPIDGAEFQPASETSPDAQHFTVRLVDELGTPIADVPLSLSHGDASDDETTDGDGQATISDDAASTATATFADPDALREALRDRWNAPRDGDALVDSADVTVIDLHGDLPGVDLQPGVPQTVSIQPYVERGRLLGGFFDTSKSFLLPGGLDGIRGIVSMYGDNDGATLLIVGHTDTAGASDYNDQLSLERATALKDYLMDNVDGWLPWYEASAPDEKRWGSDEDDAMIGALADASSRDPGEDAITWFQRTRGLAVDGIAGPETRRTLVAEYMSLEGTSLPVGITAVTHGCGENFPADPTPDGVADPDNRRVEVFFFDGILGVQPPPRGQNSKAGSKEYPEWVKRSKATTDHLLADSDATFLWLANIPDAAVNDVALVVRTKDGSELARMPAAGAQAGDDGTRTFDLSSLAARGKLLLELRDSVGLLAPETLVDLRGVDSALAADNSETAGARISFEGTHGSADPFAGPDAGGLAEANQEIADSGTVADPTAPSALA